MAKAIFNVLFKVLIGVANIVLLPLNQLLSTFVPNLSNMISYISEAIRVLITNTLSYFFYMIPPYTKYMIIFYLSFVVIYYTISYAIHGVMWIIHIIKKLPFA